MPPLAASVCEYAVPMTPLASGEAVLIVGGLVTVSVAAELWMNPPVLTTVT